MFYKNGWQVVTKLDENSVIVNRLGRINFSKFPIEVIDSDGNVIKSYPMRHPSEEIRNQWEQEKLDMQNERIEHENCNINIDTDKVREAYNRRIKKWEHDNGWHESCKCSDYPISENQIEEDDALISIVCQSCFEGWIIKTEEGIENVMQKKEREWYEDDYFHRNSSAETFAGNTFWSRMNYTSFMHYEFNNY